MLLDECFEIGVGQLILDPGVDGQISDPREGLGSGFVTLCDKLWVVDLVLRVGREQVRDSGVHGRGEYRVDTKGL